MNDQPRRPTIGQLRWRLMAQYEQEQREIYVKRAIAKDRGDRWEQLEGLLYRMIAAIDNLTEQVRFDDDLIQDLKNVTNQLLLEQKRIARVTNPDNENRARKRRNQW